MRGDAAWSFAQTFYAYPGAAPALLRLQDDHGADIPLILILLYAAFNGGSLDAAAVDDLMRVTGAWAHDVVTPLRRARRAIKAAAPTEETLYGQAKAVELAAEEAIIRRTAPPSLAPGSPSGAAAGANLEAYRGLLGLAGRPFDPIVTAFAAFAAGGARAS